MIYQQVRISPEKNSVKLDVHRPLKDLSFRTILNKKLFFLLCLPEQCSIGKL